MEYSVQAYIQRQSTQVLESFLIDCERTGQMEAYSHIIPEILAELEKRKNQ